MKLKLVIILALFTISSCFLNKPKTPSELRGEAEKLVEEGVYFLQVNKIDNAEKKFRKAIILDSNYKTPYNNLAILLINRGEIKEAKILLKKAIAIDGEYAGAYNNLGVIYLKSGQYGLASESFKKALSINPKMDSARLNLANSYEKLKRYDLTKKEIVILLKRNLRNVDARLALVRMYVLDRKYSLALKHLRFLIKRFPKLAIAYANAGLIYQMLDNNKVAIDNYKQAIFYNPNFSQVYYVLGEIFLKNGEYEKSLPYFKKVVELSIKEKTSEKETGRALFQIGTVFDNLGKYNLSAISYNNAKKFDPELNKEKRIIDPFAHYAIGVIYQNREHYKEAINEFILSLKKKPDFLLAHYRLGVTYYQLANVSSAEQRKDYYQKAETEFQKAIELKRDFFEAHYQLALVYYRVGTLSETYLQKGKYRKALFELQRSSTAYQDKPEFYIVLGVIYSKLDEYKSAVESFTKASKYNKTNPLPYFLAGISSYKMKDYTSAEKFLKQSLEFAPNDQDSLYILGLVYEETGKKEEAAKYFSKTIYKNTKDIFPNTVTTPIEVKYPMKISETVEYQKPVTN